jgi:hypothetical protein
MYFCVKPKPVLRFVGLGWALYRSFKLDVHRIRMRSFPCQNVATGGGRVPNFRCRI